MYFLALLAILFRLANGSLTCGFLRSGACTIGAACSQNTLHRDRRKNFRLGTIQVPHAMGFSNPPWSNSDALTLQQ